MSVIEENNKLRIRQIGDLKANDLTKREMIAINLLSNLLSRNDISEEDAIDKAIKLTDVLIEKLNK